MKKRISARQEPLEDIIIMKQKWRDLLFIHWEYDPDEIQAALPEGLFVDTFNDKAYLGITPFFLFDLKILFFPSIPFVSNFPEVNVRTYVYDKNGTPGIWFYSLDADNQLAVKAAQQLKLPYKYAEIKAKNDETSDEIFFEIKREKSPRELISKFRYTKNSNEFFADSETLEYFLIERYILFAYDDQKGNMLSCQVHHQPYPLRRALLSEYDSNLVKLNNFRAKEKEPDHIICSDGVDVNIYEFKKT